MPLNLLNNNLENRINIPTPKIVATWFGPNPPDVAKFDAVPVTESLILVVYKNKYTTYEIIGNSAKKSTLLNCCIVIFFL